MKILCSLAAVMGLFLSTAGFADDSAFSPLVVMPTLTPPAPPKPVPPTRMAKMRARVIHFTVHYLADGGFSFDRETSCEKTVDVPVYDLAQTGGSVGGAGGFQCPVALKAAGGFATFDLYVKISVGPSDFFQDGKARLMKSYYASEALFPKDSQHPLPVGRGMTMNVFNSSTRNLNLRELTQEYISQPIFSQASPQEQLQETYDAVVDIVDADR